MLVVASGAKRMDEARIAAALSCAIGKAEAAFVRHHTGFALGGVAPMGHRTPPVTFLDRSLYDLGQSGSRLAAHTRFLRPPPSSWRPSPVAV